jgi:flagellar basal-body rod protein FlgG
VVSNIITDHTAGNIKNTGVATDLALSGDGFFVIQTPDGERFTRDGSFKINDAGFLVNNVGYPVMNTENQPIAITGEFNVQKNGDILVDNQPIATLKIVDFADRRYLQKEGGWMNARGQGYNVLQNPGVLQFYQESSNVNTMKEMVNLISATRAYEASQKVVQAVDETMGIAINDVGAVS